MSRLANQDSLTNSEALIDGLQNLNRILPHNDPDSKGDQTGELLLSLLPPMPYFQFPGVLILEQNEAFCNGLASEPSSILLMHLHPLLKNKHIEFTTATTYKIKN